MHKRVESFDQLEDDCITGKCSLFSSHRLYCELSTCGRGENEEEEAHPTDTHSDVQFVGNFSID